MRYIKPELEIIKINAEDIMAASSEGVAPKGEITFGGTTTLAEDAGSVNAASIFDN